MGLLLRVTVSIILTIVAALFVIAPVGMLTRLPAQAERDRVHYQNFSEAAELAEQHVRENGELPDSDVLRRLTGDDANTAFFISPSADGACGGFEKAEDDRFVLVRWRGDWNECFAYPSGETTLGLSVRGYILQGFGLELALYGMIALGSIWLIRRLWKRPMLRTS